MVAVHCFIWPPMSTVLQADKNCVCFKSLPGCVLFFYAAFDVRWTNTVLFCKGDFHVSRI